MSANRRLDGLWRHPDFVRLWSAQTISVFGSLITHSALPFTAILALDAAPWQVAVLSAAGIVPSLAFGLVAGVWVDRLPRRPLMVAADLGRAALLLSIPLAWAFDALRIEQLYAVAVLAGTLTIVFDVAYQAYLPTLVSQDELLEGNSKLAASASVSEFAGFGVSGWLVQALTGPGAVLIDAVTFVVSAVFVRSIRTPEPPLPRPDAGASVRREAVDGLRAVARHPVLRAVGAATVLYALGFGIFGSTYLLFVTRGLGFDPGVLGVIFGMGGLSSLAGALLAERAAVRLGVGVAMVTGLLMMGGSMLLTPLAAGATLAGASLLIAQQISGDGAFTVFDINEVSLRQAVAPEGMLGRVNACMRILLNGSQLAGAAIGGLLAETVGLRGATACGGAFVIAAGVALALSPVLGQRQAARPAVVLLPPHVAPETPYPE